MPRPRARVQADVELPDPAPDGYVYVSARVASAVTGASARAIRYWREWGWLPDAAQETGGRRLLLFRLDHVLAADQRARAGRAA